MKNNRIPFLVVAIAIAILAVPVAVSATHQWGDLKWKSKAPVSLTLGDNVSSTWDAHLSVAIADWDASTVLSLTEVPGAANNAMDCLPETGKIEVCNFDYGSNGWVGIAQGWVAKRNRITRANARLNDYYFDNVAPYNTDASAWRQLIMCHEIGHDFGLDHQDENKNNVPLGTCMDYVSGPLTTLDLHPNKHDYDQLIIMYGSGGGGKPTNVGKGKGNGGDKPGFTAASDSSKWGRAIGRDGNGRPNEFVRDLGNGNRVITHVLWAN